jgi:hypothetical protein
VLGLFILGEDVVGDDRRVCRDLARVSSRRRRQVCAQRRHAVLPARAILRTDDLLEGMDDVEDVVHPPDRLVVATVRASVELGGAVAVELGELRAEGGSGAAGGGAELLEVGGKGGGV